MKYSINIKLIVCLKKMNLYWYLLHLLNINSGNFRKSFKNLYWKLKLDTNLLWSGILIWNGGLNYILDYDFKIFRICIKNQLKSSYNDMKLKYNFLISRISLLKLIYVIIFLRAKSYLWRWVQSKQFCFYFFPDLINKFNFTNIVSR